MRNNLLVERPCRIWHSKWSSQQPLQNKCWQARWENSVLACVTAQTSQNRNVSLATSGCTFPSFVHCLLEAYDCDVDAVEWCVNDFTDAWDELQVVGLELTPILWDDKDEDVVWRSCRIPKPPFGWFTDNVVWENVCWWVDFEGIIDEVDNVGDWDGNNWITSADDHRFKWRYIFASEGDIWKTIPFMLLGDCGFPK